MKRYFLNLAAFLTFLFTSGAGAFAQHHQNWDTVNNRLTRFFNSLDCDSVNRSNLKSFLLELPFIGRFVNNNNRTIINIESEKSFRRLIRSNFNNTVLGNIELPKITKYATLDLSDKPSFSFSPIVLESNDLKQPYTNNYQFTFNGKLNKNGFFDLKNYRELSGSFSWNHIFRKTNFSHEKVDAILTKDSSCIRKKIKKWFDDSVADKICDTCSKDVAKRREQIYNEWTGFENDLISGYWIREAFWWMNVNVTAGSDKIKYLPASALPGGIYKPNDQSVFIPSITASLNYYSQNLITNNSFFVTFWTAVKVKHSLSEVFDPTSFQSFRAINDSLMMLQEKEDVFLTDFSELKRKTTLDVGLRLVSMKTISSNKVFNKLGASFSFSRIGLVNDLSFPSLFRTEAGLIFPFLKQTGEDYLNIELFYRKNVFSNFNNSNDHSFGFRFNIPLLN